MELRNATPMQRALLALRGHWQTALLIAFAASLIQLAPQVLLYLRPFLTEEVLDAAQAGNTQMLRTLAGRWVRSGGGWILGLTGFSLLVSPVLTCGLMLHLLKLHRKQAAVFGDIAARMRYALKIIALQLLKAGGLLLWMLPGILLTGAAFLLAAPHALQNRMLLNLYLTLSLAGTGWITVILLMTVYRYALTDWVQADAPEKSVRACFREGIARMKGKRMALFRAELLCLILTYLATLLTGTAGVLLMTVGLMAQLVLHVLQLGIRAAFYLDRTV